MTDSEAVLYLPLLPLRDVVVYPHIVIPLFVGREKSIEALEAAMSNDKHILLVAQRDAGQDDPIIEDLYEVGTVANILQLLKLPDGTVKVLVEGINRVRIDAVDVEKEYFQAEVTELDSGTVSKSEAEAFVSTLQKDFEQYVKLTKKVPKEVLSSLTGIDEPGRLSDTVASHMVLSIDQKQELLEIANVELRIEQLLSLMDSELDLIHVEKRVRGRVKKQMEKSQREYYLNEQMKAIQKELGDMDEVPNEVDALQVKIEEAGMPKEARDKTDAELAKLKMMSPMSAEASVVRSYIDWMVSIPWKKRSRVQLDLSKAEKVLDEDHYGLEEVKDRILEYLAVQKRVKKLKGPVLCLVGPPGVGKTSLGESIAIFRNK